MNVELLQYNPDCEKIVASAAKLCYSSSKIDGILNGLDEEKTALIERISEEEAVVKTQEAEDYLEQQAEILSQSGISIVPFLEDLENTLYYLAAKSVVFDSVHKKVSEALGIDVNPYVVPEKPKQEEKTAPEKEKKKSEKKKV